MTNEISFNMKLRDIPIYTFGYTTNITNIVSWGGVTNVSTYAFSSTGVTGYPLSVPSVTTNALGEQLTFGYQWSGGRTLTVRDAN